MVKRRGPRDRANVRSAAAKQLAAIGGEKFITTGVRMPKRYLRLLRQVAFARSDVYGGRASVSALICKLIELHEKELERAMTNPALVPYLVREGAKPED